MTENWKSGDSAWLKSNVGIMRWVTVRTVNYGLDRLFCVLQ